MAVAFVIGIDGVVEGREGAVEVAVLAEPVTTIIIGLAGGATGGKQCEGRKDEQDQT